MDRTDRLVHELERIGMYLQSTVADVHIAIERLRSSEPLDTTTLVQPIQEMIDEVEERIRFMYGINAETTFTRDS